MTATRLAYLDHAASSPLRPEVAEAMAPYGDDWFGNPSGSHRLARRARLALEEAREAVAASVGAPPEGVVFTSGGTEADNLAVLGTLAARLDHGLPHGVVVCSAVEHAAVLEACGAAARGSARVFGAACAEVREAPVDADGAVDLEALAGLLGPEVALVSVMTANNEVGTIQPVAAVAELVRRAAPGAVVHTDAVQAATYLDLPEATAGADLVSVSAHKLGGPKGSGALVARREVPIAPLVFGGGQERGRRSGTQNVSGAVGLAAALESAARCRQADAERVASLRGELADGLLARVPGTVESVDRARTLPGHCHLRFAGVEQEELLVLLDDLGVCASGGAACASGALKASHVLSAMGVGPADARSAVRFTLGYTTTEADVAHALAAVPAAVAQLRG
ncbi:MAG TPA: cysteine desulfurase family protein [Acidimicrobiales bacterium]|nr:cysteine desulfurase family protein [Acidimicrobiales bacterium]